MEFDKLTKYTAPVVAILPIICSLPESFTTVLRMVLPSPVAPGVAELGDSGQLIPVPSHENFS